MEAGKFSPGACSFCSWWKLSSWFATGYLFAVFSGAESESSLVSLLIRPPIISYKGPTFMTLFYFPSLQALSPNSITLEVRISTCESWVDTIQPIAKPKGEMQDHGETLRHYFPGLLCPAWMATKWLLELQSPGRQGSLCLVSVICWEHICRWLVYVPMH